MRSEDAEPVQLIVDISRCDGCGACASVYPERISPGPWGFPRVDRRAVGDREAVRRAAWAVWACRRSALSLADTPVAAGSQ